MARHTLSTRLALGALALCLVRATAPEIAGTWEGESGRLKAVSLTIAGAEGKVEGKALFYITRDDLDGTHVGAATEEALVGATWDGRTLRFSVADPPVRFEMKVTGQDTAQLTRLEGNGIPAQAMTVHRNHQPCSMAFARTSFTHCGARRDHRADGRRHPHAGNRHRRQHHVFSLVQIPVLLRPLPVPRFRPHLRAHRAHRRRIRHRIRLRLLQPARTKPRLRRRCRLRYPHRQLERRRQARTVGSRRKSRRRFHRDGLPTFGQPLPRARRGGVEAPAVAIVSHAFWSSRLGAGAHAHRNRHPPGRPALYHHRGHASGLRLPEGRLHLEAPWASTEARSCRAPSCALCAWSMYSPA